MGIGLGSARRGSRGLLGAALAAISLTVAPASVQAAPTWLPPVDLSAAGRNAERPAVAVDPHGDAVAMWERSNGKNKIVQASLRAAGSGAWQEPVNVSDEGVDSFLAQVALDAGGDATTVWEQASGEEEVIESSTHPAGAGGWEKPVPLVAGGESRSPRLAVNDAGSAVAIWERFKVGEEAVLVAVRPAASEAWQKPTKLAEGGAPDVAIGTNGDAVAVWTEVVENIPVLMASFRPVATGVWGAPETLSPQVKGQQAQNPRVELDAAGNAEVVWEQYNGSVNVVDSAARPAASGIWQEPVRLSAAGSDTQEARLATNPRGDAVAAWEHLVGVEPIVQAAVRPAGGAWQAPVSISAKGQGAVRPEASIDTVGDAVAVWQRFDGSNEIVQAAVRPAASAAWGEPASLSAPGESAAEPQTAIDPYGNAVAVWERSNGSKQIVQGAGYDAAGPLLAGVSIPASGIAGQPLSFSVSPLDVWSAIGSTDWSFGDGTSATGASVSHTYAAAGTYPVALTSADVLGNPTSTSGSVTIAPAPGPSALPATPAALRPAISRARLTNRRFRVAKRSTATSAGKAPLGTSFRFALSSTARVQILITTTASGLRRGHRCVAPTAKLRRTHAKRCTRTLRLGTLTRSSERQGLDTIAFSGRIGRRPLAVGSYKATLTASNAAGRSAPVTLSFVVVR